MVSVAVNPPPPSSTRGLAHYARAHSISPYGCERVSLVYFRIFRAAGFSEYAGKRGTKVAPGSCLKRWREHTCSGGGAFVRETRKDPAAGDPKFALGDVTRARRLHAVNCGALCSCFVFLAETPLIPDNSKVFRFNSSCRFGAMGRCRSARALSGEQNVHTDLNRAFNG